MKNALPLLLLTGLGLVLATCVRESGQLWSLNPAFRAAAKVVPFDTFAPGGLD